MAGYLTKDKAGHCQTCGLEIEGHKFYCDEHRPRRKKTDGPGQRPRRTTPKAERVERQARERAQDPMPVVAVISDASGELGRRKGKVTPEETAKVLGRVLMYVSIFIAMALIIGDPELETEQDKDAQVAQLQLTLDQSVRIMHPISRALCDTPMWSKHGRKIIEHSDVIDAVAALYEWGSSVTGYQRDRVRRQRALAAGAPTVAQVVPMPTPPAPQGPGRIVEPTPPNNGHIPRGIVHAPPPGTGPREGRILTRRDLEHTRG